MKLFVPSVGFMLTFAQEDASGALVPLAAQQLRNSAYEISSILDHMIPDLEDSIPSNGLKNYGCTGVGNLDATEKNHGRPIDAVDIALNNRKKCINCAISELGSGYSTYRFDDANNDCEDSLGSASRAFCECDLQFANDLNNVKDSWNSGN